MKIVFDYEYFDNYEDLRKQIRECQGKHIHQVVYSTFHDAITQVCFTCMKIRSNIQV